jgi:hypothetical protein
MRIPRFVSLLAAVLITAAQWTPIMWLLAPTRVEATPVTAEAPDNAVPVIVVTARRPRR